MKDKGKVTVFLCLIVSAMALLGTTAVKLVSQYCAIGKAAMAGRTALSDVKADYDSYIFEHYHILLFDKNAYGKGEAAIEEGMAELMQDNLGNEFDVSDVELTGFTMIYDDDCAELKNQINEQMVYMAVSYGIDELNEKLGDREGSGSDELEDEINKAEYMPEEDEEETEQEDKNGDELNEQRTEALLNAASDPRDYTSAKTKDGVLLSVLLPLDAEVSSEDKLPDDIMSDFVSSTSSVFDINASFDTYSDLKKDIKKGNTWGDSLTEYGESILYAANVFNCFTEKDVNSKTVLECELEYIIAGEQTDYDNLEAVCKKIMAIRFPMDMAYLITDSEKMATVKTLSVPIAAATSLLTEPVVRYLIAAGWAYAEAMAETKNLLAGNKLEFDKTNENWITDLKALSESMEKEQDSDKGLSYKEYLMLLMAMEGNDIYYRMLDVMEVNARQENSGFRMSNGAVGLEADFDISYKNKNISIHQSSSYGK